MLFKNLLYLLQNEQKYINSDYFFIKHYTVQRKYYENTMLVHVEC